MTINYYRSDDTDAPELGNDIGSFANVIRKCLVDGYGNKSGAGWELVLDDLDTILIKNNPSYGNATYYRIKDDGRIQTTDTSDNYKFATITGAKNYNSMNELITTYPRTISGNYLHSNTYYGSPIIKNTSITGNKTAWFIVADSETCYFFYASSSGKTVFSGGRFYPSGFGNLGLFENILTHPRGFVCTGEFVYNTSDIIYNYSYLTTLTNSFCGYIEHSITGGSDSTKYYIRPQISLQSMGGNITLSSTAYMVPFSATDKIARFEPIYIMEDANNVIRGTKHTNHEMELFGKYRGLYASHNRIGTSTGDIGSNFDLVSYNGREYMLVVLPNDGSGGPVNTYGSFAIDMTGPWT